MKSYLIIFHLILLLFGFFFVEHHLDTPGRTAADREMLMSDGSGIAARIAAVGQINTAQAQSSTTSTQVAAASEPVADGQKVYQSGCIACHGAGVAGAPMVGNAAAWADRIAAGNDSLYANAINGLVGSSGVMPAKGGNTTLSDAEVKAAVDHMVSQSQ
ncbi:MAG TPA: cytochrome c5 family protein [Gammaproteobacteria bacterium]|jgi:cytochrome c5|nr:cytochrome c5 family protein [Gammaproteobacteria bacterium]